MKKYIKDPYRLKFVFVGVIFRKTFEKKLEHMLKIFVSSKVDMAKIKIRKLQILRNLRDNTAN